MVKKKRKYSAKTKGRMFIIFSFIGFIIVTLGYTLLINVREINVLDDEMEKLTEENRLLVLEEERLEADIKRLKDPEYIARYVREKYLYSKDGEIILRIK